MTRLAQMLVLYRDRHGISTRRTADHIGVTVSTLRRVERGATGMNAETFLRISTWMLARRENGTRLRR